jgi:hypothetical protein
MRARGLGRRDGIRGRRGGRPLVADSCYAAIGMGSWSALSCDAGAGTTVAPSYAANAARSRSRSDGVASKARTASARIRRLATRVSVLRENR